MSNNWGDILRLLFDRETGVVNNVIAPIVQQQDAQLSELANSESPFPPQSVPEALRSIPYPYMSSALGSGTYMGIDRNSPQLMRDQTSSWVYYLHEGTILADEFMMAQVLGTYHKEHPGISCPMDPTLPLPLWLFSLLSWDNRQESYWIYETFHNEFPAEKIETSTSGVCRYSIRYPVNYILPDLPAERIPWREPLHTETPLPQRVIRSSK